MRLQISPLPILALPLHSFVFLFVNILLFHTHVFYSFVFYFSLVLKTSWIEEIRLSEGELLNHQSHILSQPLLKHGHHATLSSAPGLLLFQYPPHFSSFFSCFLQFLSRPYMARIVHCTAIFDTVIFLFLIFITFGIDHIKSAQMKNCFLKLLYCGVVSRSLAYLRE